MQPMYSKIFRRVPVLLLFCLSGILLWTVLVQPYKNSPPIRSDGVGYHVWVHGFKNLDFSFCDYRSILDPTGSVRFVSKDERFCGVKYPPGVGLFQLPFSLPFALDDATNGFSQGEHMVVLALGACFILAICVFCYQSLGLLNCPIVWRVISIYAFLFGSGLFHYGTYDASFSHIYSAFGIALLLFLYIKNRGGGWNYGGMILFFILVFWMYLVRQTNGAITFCIVIMVLLDHEEGNDIKLFIKKIVSPLPILWLLATFSAIAIQVLYNFYSTGEITISSYGKEGFPSIAGNSHKVLLSYERGLFAYYPIFFLTIILASFLWRSTLFLCFLFVIVVFSALYGSWHAHSLGGGFGHRGFVETAPIGIIVLSMGLSRLKNKIVITVILCVILLCTYITMAIMVHYWQGTYPFGGATKELFFSSIIPDFITEFISQE